jgi:FKBP-type peptidyl-prolyl cis-trans isomerase FkpA
MKNAILLVLTIAVLFSLSRCAERTDGEDFTVTPSGYEMVWHERGSGEKPEVGDYLFFTASYSIDDSMLFDTRTRPDTPSIQLTAIDDPETKDDPVFNAFRLMVPGDSITVSQRGDQMEVDQHQLGENTVDFHIALHEVVSEEEFQIRMGRAQERRMQQMTDVMEREDEVEEFAREVLNRYQNNDLGGELQETPSGLQYVIHEEGSGRKIGRGEPADVHYYGLVIDNGEMFDNSFRRGEPFSLNVGAGMVIPGWDESLLLMNRGARVSVFIPYDLAYGMDGRPPVIPEQADLMFYMEIQK